MKHSGIPWIGEIPKEWGICRIKNVATLYNGNSIKDEEKDNYTNPANAIPYISTKDIDVTCQSINYENGLYTDISDNTFKVAHADSSLMCIEGGSAGKKKCYVQQDVSFVNKLCCLAPKNINGKYLFYYLCSPNFESEFNKYISGLIGGVSVSILKNIDSILPPLSEQQKIASYLDRKCSEIDEMVVLQEKIIEELKAYKQSVITEAVTKGLNPDVPMKDSGIEWIGEIPESWRVGKIKMVAKTNSGSTPKTISQTEKSSIVWIRTTDINDNFVTDSSLHLTQEELNSASCPMLNKDVCVVAMYGGGGTIGKCGILGVEATINQALCSIEVKSFHLGVFMFWTLRATRYNWMKFAVGTRKDPNISQEIVRNYIVPIPPIEEQQKISDYLNTKCSEIDNLISIKQSKIESLKEYKKSIIYEYVTGKKEVI